MIDCFVFHTINLSLLAEKEKKKIFFCYSKEMKSDLLFHFPDVICDVVLDYHLFVDIKSSHKNVNLIYAIPGNDHYFYGITTNALVRCCTQTLVTTTLLSIANTSYLLRLDAHRLVVVANDGIYIYHITSRRHTHFKQKINPSSCVASMDHDVYFTDELRLFRYDPNSNSCTHIDLDSFILSLHVFHGVESTLLIKTDTGRYFSGPSIVNYLPPTLDNIRELLPYENGIIVHRYDIGRGLTNYLFGRWSPGPPIRQFLKLPDHNYVAIHNFHITFYVKKRVIHSIQMDRIMLNAFLVKDRLFCLVYNKLIVIG